ncbi:protein translocase subunit SecD [Marinibactrum halimedae]|uniref:Protein translocase subunit SecD n=1 Tax=Marinibactrum halimedae TaxID=1444977 RepID=A0AA37TBR3_9GAMM|nr:protein translocase subunit SecD [Marinibactrum halimedae]MCD9458444.1 protein translocase subunit SecD [Marinibactrum halimedae]GLS26142.1 protein translocase subunit SecD [Marinibactrum halimedae]
MLNRYPLWKYLLVAFIVVLGAIYAAPNLYAPDPAIQISGQSSAMVIDDRVIKRVSSLLDKGGIKHFGEQATGANALIRFHSLEDQLAAKALLQRDKSMQESYVIALNQAATTPEWLRSMGASPMKLGLDLSGGVHFLLEVDTASAVAKRQDTNADELKAKWREGRVRYRGVSLNKEQVISARFDDEEERDKASSIAGKEFPNLTRLKEERDGKFYLLLSLNELAIREIEDYAVSQNLTTLRNRVNELGVSEPIVQRQGRNRIVVELPGVQDTAEAKRVIGKTANLEFRLEAESNALVSSKEYFEYRSEEDRQRFGGAYLEKKLIIGGVNVSGAKSSFDPETSQPQVNINLDSVGGTKMHRVTRNAVSRKMGVLFIEQKTRMEYSLNEDGEEVATPVQTEERRIISLATITTALGVQFRITGLESPAEASELALLLRAGALAAPMYFVQESTIGPSLGEENIELGKTSVMWGLGFVLVFMLVYYRVFGFAANLALAANMVLLVAVMSILGATLTLPGIAGIVLTVGMAVDANVLIFSRIREELKNGMPPQSAINSGFDRAFTTILDANITTLIVAIILYAIGSGPVKGFAVTLSIGILTSMFTAIMGTRSVVNLIYGGRRVEKLMI